MPTRLPRGSATPNSYSRLRSAFTVAVRMPTQCERMRCSDSSACCWQLLSDTRRKSPCWAASHIARASAASSLLPVMKARTCCAGQQLDLVAQRCQTTAPVVRAPAGLHAHSARQALGKEVRHHEGSRCASADRFVDAPAACPAPPLPPQSAVKTAKFCRPHFLRQQSAKRGRIIEGPRSSCV
jgi:hypothetical protein